LKPLPLRQLLVSVVAAVAVVSFADLAALVLMQIDQWLDCAL
jgi:hypothetical protein